MNNLCRYLTLLLILFYADPTLFSQPDLYWCNGADGIMKYSTTDDTLISLIPIVTSRPRRIRYDKKYHNLYWSDSHNGSIFKSDTTGSNLEVIFQDNTLSPFGFGFDNNLLFFTEIDSGVIYKYDLLADTLVQIVSGLQSPKDLEIDTLNNKLFWIEQTSGKLSSCDYFGNNLDLLIDSTELAFSCFAIDFDNSKIYLAEFLNDNIIVLDLNNDTIFNLPNIVSGFMVDLKLDPNENQLYWIEAGVQEIRKYNLLGSHQMTIHDLDSHHWRQTNLSCFTFGHNGKDIYYTDLVYNKLNKINYQSGSLDTLIKTQVNYPSAISVSKSTTSIYWTERSTGEIKKSNLDGSSIRTLIVDTPAQVAGLVLDEANGFLY